MKKFLCVFALMLLLVPAHAEETRTLPIDLTGGYAPKADGYLSDLEYEDSTIHVTVTEYQDTLEGQKIAYWVADVTIAAEDLHELVWLKTLSDALMRRIHGNYRFVMGFNGALIALGAFGILPPAVSALLHNASTLLLSMKSLTNLLNEEGTKEHEIS